MTRPLLEVSTEGVDGLLVAQDNGADRVELCASVREGGITPSIGIVREALHRARVPVFVIVRPRWGDFLYSEAEFESMRQDVMALKDLGVPGVVTGCLTAGGEVDEQRMAELLRVAKPMSFTFHRAFDTVRDPFQALEALINHGVDRVLTSGQHGTAMEGLANIKRLGRAANGRMIVMPCGGLRAANIGQVCRETGLWELHFAAHRKECSAMTFRNPRISLGTTPQDLEYSRTVTDPTTVRSTVEAARREFVV
jgi:copper homeostasis protein